MWVRGRRRVVKWARIGTLREEAVVVVREEEVVVEEEEVTR